MSRPVYTRYTLRLASRGVLTSPCLPPLDDWSGSAAYADRFNPEALEYASPEAVELLHELGVAGWQTDEEYHTLTFWLPEGAEAAPEAEAALARLRALGELRADSEAPGWEDAWRRFHTPCVLGRLYVRPPWYPPREDLLDVVVDAGLAFGTGGHATTRQCIEELQELTPGSLLDLGAGSGVVSFAALRLGFAPVWGVENDPVAVEAARENAERNGLTPMVSLGDVTDPACSLPEAETVVANIALQPILRLAPRFVSGPGALRPRTLILAGLLLEHAETAAAAFPGYELVGSRDDGTWITLRLQRCE